MTAAGDQYRFLVGGEARPDWGELHRFLTRNFAFMTGRIDPPSSLNRLTATGLANKAAEETLILCMKGERIVGCGFAKLVGDGLYLGKLAVDPAHRRRGVLRQMLAQADRFARSEGLSHLELETRIELVENHDTFARLGFREVDRTAHPGFNRPTSLAMQRMVATNAG